MRQSLQKIIDKLIAMITLEILGGPKISYFYAPYISVVKVTEFQFPIPKCFSAGVKTFLGVGGGGGGGGCSPCQIGLK